MRLVHTKKITDDMELAKPVFHENRILLNMGVKNLSSYKKRLLALGINYVYVHDEISKDIEVNDVIKDETRIEAQTLISDVFEDIKFNKKIEVKKVKKVVHEIVDSLFNSQDIMVNLVKINSFNSYTFSHSVNVAVLSLLLGKALRFNKKRLDKLGVGALLHDIGKVMVPESIINKPDKLTEEEYRIAQKHVLLGYNYLREETYLGPLARSAVLGHHERLDSSGYPEGKPGEDISEFGLIVGITDVFDALTSNRVYRKRWPIHKAIDCLTANAHKKFKGEYVQAFIRHIALYPNGIEVRLSNGARAIVKEQNENYPTRPVVGIIKEENSKDAKLETIDLLDNNNIVITEVI